MKRMLVFAALVAVLALSISLGEPGTALADNVCEDIHGQPCRPNGATIGCVSVDGWSSSCNCWSGSWVCTL